MNFKKVFSTIFICFFLIFSLNQEASAKGRGVGGKAAKSFIGALAKNFGLGKRAAISAQAKAKNKLIPRALRGFQGMKPKTAAKVNAYRKNIGAPPLGIVPKKSQRKLFSPIIRPKEVNGKTPAQIEKLAKKYRLIPNKKTVNPNDKDWNDPVTGKQRLSAHNIGLPKNGPKKTRPHNHLNPPNGKKNGRLTFNGKDHLDQK